MRRPLQLALAMVLAALAREARAQSPATPFDAPELLFKGYGLVEDGAAVGVPLGGLGTGRLDLCADGTFRNLTLGPTTDVLAWHSSAFVEVAAERGPAPAVRRALVSRSAGGLPGVGKLVYRGLFPRAFLRATDDLLGLQVDVEAFSPLVPHDVEASSWPAIGFRVRVREAAGAPARVAVTLHVPSPPD